MIHPNTRLKRTMKWVLVHSRSGTTIAMIHFRVFASPKEPPAVSPAQPPGSPGTTSYGAARSSHFGTGGIQGVDPAPLLRAWCIPAKQRAHGT